MLHWNAKECLGRPYLIRHDKKYITATAKEHHPELDFTYGETELKSGVPYEVYLWWDKEEGCYVRNNHVTDALIWGSMMIDLGKITEKNVWEVYRRYQVWNRLGFCKVYNQSWEVDYDDSATTERNLTIEDIRSHIGLTTNVGDTSKAKFRSRVATWIMDKADEGVRSAKYSS
jgi:hypothetical protein